VKSVAVQKDGGKVSNKKIFLITSKMFFRSYFPPAHPSLSSRSVFDKPLGGKRAELLMATLLLQASKLPKKVAFALIVDVALGMARDLNGGLICQQHDLLKKVQMGEDISSLTL
jgi:hypothetical protein